MMKNMPKTPHSSTVSGVLAGLALLASGSVARAQAPPDPAAAPGAPTFRESVEVRVMDLDVSVTDSKGNPVPDLDKGDFRISVDGKPVAIDYFTRIAEGTIHSPDLAAASPDRVLAEYRKGTDAYIVTRMGPSDLGRVVVFDRRGKEQTEWTASKEALLSALTKVESTGVGMARLMSEQQTLHEIDQNRSRSSREMFARSYGEQVKVEITNLLRDMSAELTTLTALPGKRSFVLVSGGFDMQPGSAMMQYAAGSFSLRTFDTGDMSREVEALARKANATDVTFYTVDARGLSAEGNSASNDDPLSARPGIAFFARQDSQAGLQSLAYETGGIALLNTNALATGLERVYRDTSTYYSVGVSLNNVPGTGYRKIQVAVTRPGLTVRSRRAFAPRTPVELSSDVAQAALRSNIQYRGIAVNLAVAPAVKSKKYFNVPVVVTVPASSLTFLPNGEARRAVADLFVGVLDEQGRMSDITRQEASFTLPPDAPADAPVRYTANLEMRKGNARIVVNVRDHETGKMGTARADVHVE